MSGPLRVLVSGAAGTIGREVVASLRQAGCVVSGVDRHRGTELDERLMIGECTSYEFAREVTSGIDVLVHLAAEPSPDPVAPERTFINNSRVSFNLIYAAAEQGATRIVAASSISVLGTAYSPSASPQLAYLPVDEDIPIEPADTYALSKELDEAVLRMVTRRFGTTTVGLRIPLVGGQDLLARVAALAREDPSTRFRELWSYLDIRDAARTFTLAATRPGLTGSMILNAVSPVSFAGLDIARLVPHYYPAVSHREQIPPGRGAYTTDRAALVLDFTAEWCWCGRLLAEHAPHLSDQPRT